MLRGLILLFLVAGCASLPQAAQLQKKNIQVEVRGAVMHPGIYELSRNAVIGDAIEAAGGLLPDADISNLNLLFGVGNQDVIQVSAKQEKLRISINTGSADQLMQLPGIGSKTAEAIIAYRQQNGLFQMVEELMQVKGIGPKKFAKLQEYISL